MALKLYTAPTLEPITLSQLKEHLRLDSGSMADNLTGVYSIAPDSHAIAAAYSLVGAWVEVLGYSALVQLIAGAVGAGGSVACKLQESDDQTAIADVTGGAFTTVTAANDEATQELAYTGTRRYIRTVATIAGAACKFSTIVQKGASYSTEDDWLTLALQAAREYCEGIQNRAYLTQTWDLWLDKFPSRNYIEIPLPPLAVLTPITGVYYYGTDDTMYTLAATDYYVDNQSEPGRVGLNYGESWPSTTLRDFNGVRVRFIAGVTTAALVNARVKHAIKLLVAHWYNNRETVAIGTLSKELEFTVSSLLSLDRVVPV